MSGSLRDWARRNDLALAGAAGVPLAAILWLSGVVATWPTWVAEVVGALCVLGCMALYALCWEWRQERKAKVQR